MTIRKAILALCMVGFLVVSALSMVGQDFYLPGSFLGELTGNGGGRLVVRSERLGDASAAARLRARRLRAPDGTYRDRVQGLRMNEGLPW